jgi:hypothetical protein
MRDISKLAQMRTLAESAVIIGKGKNLDTWPAVVVQLIDEIVEMVSEVGAANAYASRLEVALADCRGAVFNEEGPHADGYFESAMADPLDVPAYVAEVVKALRRSGA